MCLRRTRQRNVSWPVVTRYEQHTTPLMRSFQHQKVLPLRIRNADGSRIGDAAGFVFRLARCRHAEAEKAGVVAGELGFDVGVVVEIGANDLAQLRMLLSCDSPPD